ncbi:MAG TPA: type II toxin-antitoxin system HigB family toxin [Planctomycetota bacterium]|nr:type II toxin-antitoxin system HigB family toxin [Planctomycetota bacterium]
MWLISRTPLMEFIEIYPDAEGSLLAWIHEIEAANWKNLNEVKAMYATASIVQNKRIIFTIRGNHYRLVAAFLFNSHQVLVKFIGTHKHYDAIDATTVELP